jgi:hypothetical protein
MRDEAHDEHRAFVNPLLMRALCVDESEASVILYRVNDRPDRKWWLPPGPVLFYPRASLPFLDPLISTLRNTHSKWAGCVNET